MKAHVASVARRAVAGPAPVRASANLLVHDLKNLAGRLAALCHNLGERFDDPVFRTTALGVLGDTARHLQRLAADLREREGRVLVKLRVDLNFALEEALNDTRPVWNDAVHVVERYGDLPPVWGDAFLLREAFSRALENAVQAMGAQGTLAIRTAFDRRTARGLLVEIRDTGPGIDRTFLRSSPSRPFRSTKKDGQGLGIYTMRQVAALHGGTVRFLSAPGKGTIVRFRFPREDR